MDNFINFVNNCKTFEELYEIRWKLHLGEKIKKHHYENIKIALINVPCGGYGDVIKCIKMFDYINKWYPGINVKILSASKEKFRNLGIKEKIIDIKHKNINKDNECAKFKDLIIANKTKYDFFLIVPVISEPFNIKDFQKLIPYANTWNTFSMSEYNDIDTEPHDFPIGVGKGNLGLFFDKPYLIKQRMIKNPYALVYIQPSDDGLLHSRYCFLSYIEMVFKNKKYSNYKTFEIIVPKWITNDIINYKPFKYECLKIIKKYYNILEIITSEDTINIFDKKDKQRLSKRKSRRKSIRSIRSISKNNYKGGDKIYKKCIIRGDILPQPREKFIGFIKDSIDDILLTGDESLVDALNCCNKTIWYQIAPWKVNLADNLYLETGNRNYKTYKTSCGNLKGYQFKNDVSKLIKENDFRIKGKERFNSALIGFYANKDKDIKKIIGIIESSINLDSIKKKIKNM